MEAARLQANLTAQLEGPPPPTREQAWEAQWSITKTERKGPQRVYDQYHHEGRCARARQAQPVTGRAAKVFIDRIAIARALVECGYLLFRWRRVSPPITRRRVEKIP